jgi:hypothetical protein
VFRKIIRGFAVLTDKKGPMDPKQGFEIALLSSVTIRTLHYDSLLKQQAAECDADSGKFHLGL